MTELAIGVIGFGLRGGLARHAHQPGEGSRVVAVCDPRPERRQAAIDRFGPDVRVTGDPDELLSQPLDAVFVLSPDWLHEESAVAALSRGVAVYVEKPMAITTAGCDRMLEVAQRYGAKLYVGHNMRHMPAIVAMRDLIAAGAIGDVKSVWCRHFVGHGGDFYFKDWHAERRFGTGLLLQKGAHDIDVIHWLAGGYTRRVNALGALSLYGDISDRAANPYKDGHPWDEYERNWPPLAQRGMNPLMDVEDLNLVNLALDNGVLASYVQCHYTPDYWRNYTVIGTEGRLENFGDGDGATIKIWNRRHHGYAADGDREIQVPPAEGGHGGADPSIVAEFLRFVRGEAPTRVSVVAAREAVAAGCAATESLRDGGRPVDVPALDAARRSYFDQGQTASAAPAVG